MYIDDRRFCINMSAFENAGICNTICVCVCVHVEMETFHLVVYLASVQVIQSIYGQESIP